MAFFTRRVAASALGLAAALAASVALYAQDAGAVNPPAQSSTIERHSGSEPSPLQPNAEEPTTPILPTDMANASSDNSIPAAVDASSSHTWNTFAGGSANDQAASGVVDAGGNYYIVGASHASWGAPVRAFTASGADAVVAKFNSSGVLLWNTFLGSSAHDLGYDLAVDSSGRVYVIGYSGATWGAPLRPHAGADAFVARLASNGALEWVTFLGGAQYGHVAALTLIGSDIYVAGVSQAGWGFPVRPHAGGGTYDMFVARLNDAGAVQSHTFLGGSQFDEANDIAATGANELYVTGYSDSSWGAPVILYHGGRDAVVARLNAGGTLVWHAFLGSADTDVGLALAANGSSGVILGVYSAATWGNNPYNRFNGGNDGLIAAVSSLGSVSWNTFLTINYTSLPARTVGNPPFALNITATSGLPVTFAAQRAMYGARQHSVIDWGGRSMYPHR